MPAPTMMMSSPIVTPGSAVFHKTHAEPRRAADRLTCKALGAGPEAKARIVVGRPRPLLVTMRAPAVFIGRAGEFTAAARLRAVGKAARKIRLPALAYRGKDIAAPWLIAEEMRRGRHHRRIRRLLCHPVDAGKMKAAEAAGLVTARASDVVEPALETRNRTDIFQRNALRRGFPQRRDHLAFAKHLIAVAVGLHDAECRLQVR